MACRMRPKYQTTPSVASNSAAVGTAAAGPTPNTDHTTNATYMPSMTKSPWAKLMTFIMPQISVRPEENSAYTAPRSSPPTITWTRVRDIAPDPGRPRYGTAGSPALVGERRLRGGTILGPHRHVVLAVLELHHERRGEAVLALLVELHAPEAEQEFFRLE